LSCSSTERTGVTSSADQPIRHPADPSPPLVAIRRMGVPVHVISVCRAYRRR